jgi:peptidoglycan/xylan/chitin deacetylase (PgdA/CDA1 family)
MGFRLDRIATLYIASPLSGMIPNRETTIPILMYHGIGCDQSGIHPYYRTVTSPAMFALQLKHLFDDGYTSCTLEQAVHQLQSNTATKKSVVITFDDGYRDFYCDAFPVLSQYGFTATMFLPTAYIGKTSISFNGRECLTWAQILELSHHGIRFGSHTVTHPQLRDLSFSAIHSELTDSKKTIEDQLGLPVESFAYPFAFPQADIDFKNKLRDSLHAIGYQNGVSTAVGRARKRSEPLFLERLPINSGDDLQLFDAKLHGHYDWIRIPQRLVKAGKRVSESLLRSSRTSHVTISTERSS